MKKNSLTETFQEELKKKFLTPGRLFLTKHPDFFKLDTKDATLQMLQLHTAFLEKIIMFELYFFSTNYNLPVLYGIG